MMRTVLASASPRRRDILKAMGVNFDILAIPHEEKTGTNVPEKMVEELARQKGEICFAHLGENGYDPKDTFLIAADTVVAFGDRILGKPKDREEARAMLRALSGKTHHVLTGLYLRYGDRTVLVHDRADVQFAPLSDGEIEHYLDCGEYADKAGSYGIQGRAGIFVRKIDGDYQNVVGLPCRKFYEETVKLLGFWPY